MDVRDFVTRPSPWLHEHEPEAIVVTSRVRLARNLKTAPFPGWAGPEERDKIWSLVKPVLQELNGLDDPVVAEMSDLDELDKQVLFERYLISREHHEKKGGAGLVVSQDERTSIMVNEEDHLRIQSLSGGLNLVQLYERISQVDNEIEDVVDYAYSCDLGYLTSCPSNVGTGMRASCMIHVPGLVLMGEINPIVKGLGKIGLAVRGLGGEGSESCGNLFQISNQITLGDSEENMINNLNHIVLEIIEHERNARIRLLENREHVVYDHIGRAQGILTRAHVLTSKEALDLLSGLRLGVELGIITHINYHVIDDLQLQTRPGHLQKLEGRKLGPEERDIARARLVRERIGSVEG